MAPQVTIWNPDTCGCEVAIHWDDTEPEDARQHTFRVRKRCPAHVTAAAVEAGPTVHEENTRKNRAVAKAAAELGIDPTTIGHGYEGPDRTLVLSLPPGVSAAAKGRARAAVAAELGHARHRID